MPCCRDRLIEDNVCLVYFLFHKLTKSAATVQYKEDIISEGMLGLVKAADNFDEKRGIKFSTFAAMCVRNQMLMFIRKLNKHMPHEISLYQPIGIDAEGRELYLSDVLEDTSQNAESYCLNGNFEEFVAKQKPIDQKILSASKCDYKQREIAEQLKISQSYISRRLRRLRRNWCLFSS